MGSTRRNFMSAKMTSEQEPFPNIITEKSYIVMR